MIESNPLSWLALLALIMVSTLAGVGLSRRMPWSNLVKGAQLDVAFGVVLAPFLAGIAAVMVLLLFPGASHLLHILCVYGVLGLAALLVLKPLGREPAAKLQRELTDVLLIGLLLAWVVFLLVNAVSIPLAQNDALEYAIVGRELFHARDLTIYPLLDPISNASGFFAPWTHPPLYVSLIYLMSALQGHADAPGLMRLIAPWFLLTATCATVMLGRLQSANTGWLAGLLMISTPLLFLGADSALIDALPVSGMVLLLVSMVGLNTVHRLYGVVLGGVLGLTLWTHSQAILFVPLMAAAFAFRYGLKNWFKSIKTGVICFVVAVLVGGWPYLRNYLLFGSPVSDNPAVFAMAELDWRSYFAYARGLDHNTAIVQYGVFKGWFSLEAYGWLFWLGSGGILLFLLRQSAGHLSGVVVNGLDVGHDRDSALWLGLVLVLTYLVGVVLSVALGIDLMIRNERYMLVIAPILALNGAYLMHSLCIAGWKRISDSATRFMIKNVVVGVYGLLGVILLLQLIFLGWHYRWRNVVSMPEVTAFTEEREEALNENFSRFDWILHHWPSFRVVKKMAKELPVDAKVLAMRPADMYYADRRMVSYLDPSLLPFYREKYPVRAAQMLKALGIRYVFMTDYFLPPVYNSTLMSILGDPGLSRLAYSSGTTQLYELANSGQKLGEPLDLTPGNFSWTRTLQLRLGGRKAVNALGFASEEFKGGQSISSFPLFHRDYSVMLATGLGGGIYGGRHSTFTKVKPGGEYTVRMNLEGEGYIVLWLSQFDDRGGLVITSTIDRESAIRIGDMSLSGAGSGIDFMRRFRLEPTTHKIRIGVEHVGRSQITIKDMTLERVLPRGRSDR